MYVNDRFKKTWRKWECHTVESLLSRCYIAEIYGNSILSIRISYLKAKVLVRYFQNLKRNHYTAMVCNVYWKIVVS